MYKTLKIDYPSFVPPPNNGGLLTPWAERGVLMINTCLTVRAHEANSHQKRGWEALTQKVIDLVAQKRTRGVVFLAWGKSAGDRVAKVDTKKHLVLKSVHPSPLSASRGFFECGHFRKTNEWLLLRYGPTGEIDWNLNANGAPTTSTSTTAAAVTAEEKTEEPTPVVAVGEVQDETKGEKSTILEKQGEKGTGDGEETDYLSD
jgi:uracil-DNA glycosylase